MNNLRGLSGYCDGHSVYYGIGEAECNRIAETVAGGIILMEVSWTRHDINFDNIFDSMISLFVLSTLEGWPDYIFELIDGGTNATGPIKNRN
jgi:hypothetical protein